MSAREVSAGVTAASDAVRGYGKASVGDKTMVDALVPFAETLAERAGAGDALADAWGAAAIAARSAADATSDLMPGLAARARTARSRSARPTPVRSRSR